MGNTQPTINERLTQCIRLLKNLQTLERRKKNQEQQIINDNKFQNLVQTVTQLSYTVHYAQESLAFSYEPQAILIDILKDLQTTASKESVNEDSIIRAARKLKPVQDQTKKEWTKHYSTLVNSVISTLQIIHKIDPVSVNKCLADIQEAAVWQNDDSDLPHLKALYNALDNSNAIIERLGLDQNITTFLTKVSSKTATLNDITEEILAWIRRERLSDRIVVSFK